MRNGHLCCKWFISVLFLVLFFFLFCFISRINIKALHSIGSVEVTTSVWMNTLCICFWIIVVIFVCLFQMVHSVDSFKCATISKKNNNRLECCVSFFAFFAHLPFLVIIIYLYVAVFCFSFVSSKLWSFVSPHLIVMVVKEVNANETQNEN